MCCSSSFKLWRAMVRVHSASSQVASSSSDDQPPAARPSQLLVGGEKPEVFTIWMKSLVLNGSGCTVYDSAGSIVYRVDNYGARRAADVCLMDLAGNVVLQILKKVIS